MKFCHTSKLKKFFFSLSFAIVDERDQQQQQEQQQHNVIDRICGSGKS